MDLPAQDDTLLADIVQQQQRRQWGLDPYRCFIHLLGASAGDGAVPLVPAFTLRIRARYRLLANGSNPRIAQQHSHPQ